jgi:pantoate--beta-alanine ligase
MKTLDTVRSMKWWTFAERRAGAIVGFVPTMGALHEGHLSLVKAAQKTCDRVVVSVFLNPTQFNDPKDLEKYPKTLEQDTEKLRAQGVDILFTPKTIDLYPDNYRYRLNENLFSHQLCGKSRPGHFDGVLTVVMKLFMIVQPQVAFFGEKDFQQLRLIQEMAKAFFLEVDVVGLPTVREVDGLAMSSRNQLLTPEHRERAPFLYRALLEGRSVSEVVASLTNAGFQVDFVEEMEGRRFAAARLGEVRLIDNVAMEK